MYQRKKTRSKMLSFLLALTMVIGLMPGMSLMAYAEAPSGSTPGEKIGETVINNDSHVHANVTFTAWTDDLAAQQNGSGATAANSLPKVAGNYYLTKDIELNSELNKHDNNYYWEVPRGTTNLCLNGYGIKSSFNRANIAVKGDSIFNLYEEKGKNGTISNTNMNAVAPVLVSGYGIFNMYGGKISGNNTNVGGVYVLGATFNIYGGEISNNTGNNAGGIYVKSITLSSVVISSTINISGDPVITGNKVSAENDSQASNVYLGNDCRIGIAGELTNTNPIGIRMQTPGVFTNSTGAIKASDYKDKFISDDSTYEVKADGNELTLAITPLAQAKQDAKAKLKAKYEVLNGEDYDTDGTAELKTVYDNAVESIDAATIVDTEAAPEAGGVWKAEQAGETALDKVKTKVVKEVESKIDALPAGKNVKISDKAAIEAARKAYEALPSDQKAKVSDETLAKLESDEAILKALETADAAQKAQAKAEADKKAAEAAAAQSGAESAAAKEAQKKAEAAAKAAEEARAKAEAAQKAAEEKAAEAEKNSFEPLDQVKITKIKGAKKKATIKWEAVDGAKGYQIVVAKNKKGTKQAKYYTVKGSTKVKKVIKKLKKGKYYVKARAYKTYKGNTVYGKFSKVKAVKVK